MIRKVPVSGVLSPERSDAFWHEKAMKAFGQIIKSRFILRYIDEVELRQVIEKQLNKAEFANRFTRAVAVGNARGLEHAEKAEQEIAESCNRLIRNCIVCWNYLYMTCQLEAARTPEERDRLLRMIAIHSPQSWRHFNLLGEYDFSSEKLQDNSGALPPKTARRIIPENWEPPTRRKEQRAKGIRKSLWYFTYLGWVETDGGVGVRCGRGTRARPAARPATEIRLAHREGAPSCR